MKNINTLSLERTEGKEAFWRQHHKAQKTGKLSRKEYCKVHNLNYGRFGYWVGKWNSLEVANLLPIKLIEESRTTASKILGTLDLKNGCSLKIHDMEVIASILERNS